MTFIALLKTLFCLSISMKFGEEVKIFMQKKQIKKTISRACALLLTAMLLIGTYIVNVSASYGSKTVFTVFDFDKEKLGSNIWDGPTREKGQFSYKVVNSTTANGGKGIKGIQGQAIEAHWWQKENSEDKALIFGTHLSTPIDLSVYGNGKYALKVRIYFDEFDPLYNPTVGNIAGPDWGVEMSNNGNADTKSYRWSKKGFMPHAGWNELYLPIRAEYISNTGLGRINLAKVNFFRFWNTAHSTTYAVLDSVTIVDYTEETAGASGNVLTLDTCDDSVTFFGAGIDTSNKKQGFASVAAVAWNPNQAAGISRKWSTPIDTKVNENTGSLKLWIYISKIDNAKELSVELTSGGEADRSEINWSKDKLNLKNGWNEVTLKMKDAKQNDGVTGKAYDPSALNFFRIYAIATKPLMIAVDDIRIIKSDGNYTTASTGNNASQINTQSAGQVSSKNNTTLSNTNTVSGEVVSTAEETISTDNTGETISDAIVSADNQEVLSSETTGASNEPNKESKLPLILLFIGLGIVVLGGTGAAVYFLVLKKKN